MTWSYSGDPTTSELDKYRFTIGDTIQADPILQNEEITYILGEATEENRRLFELFDRCANIISRKTAKKRLGPQSEDNTDRLNFFQEKAKFYRTLCSAGTGLSLPKSAPQIFSKGMHDNHV